MMGTMVKVLPLPTNVPVFTRMHEIASTVPIFHWIDGKRSLLLPATHAAHLMTAQM